MPSDTEASKPEVADVKIEATETKDAATKSSPECAAGPCPGFGKCDGSYKDKGCIDGKIQGGLAVVPGLGWWPIKVSRFSVCAYSFTYHHESTSCHSYATICVCSKTCGPSEPWLTGLMNAVTGAHDCTAPRRRTDHALRLARPDTGTRGRVPTLASFWRERGGR